MAAKSRSRNKKPASRRGPGGRSGHHPGRTTDPASVPRPPSARKVFRIRPTWHKVVGFFFLLMGLTIIIINYWAEFGADFVPGGHQLGYFMLGMVVAGSSAWWFGLVDKPL